MNASAPSLVLARPTMVLPSWTNSSGSGALPSNFRNRLCGRRVSACWPRRSPELSGALVPNPRCPPPRSRPCALLTPGACVSGFGRNRSLVGSRRRCCSRYTMLRRVFGVRHYGSTREAGAPALQGGPGSRAIVARRYRHSQGEPGRNTACRVAGTGAAGCSWRVGLLGEWRYCFSIGSAVCSAYWRGSQPVALPRHTTTTLGSRAIPAAQTWVTSSGRSGREHGGSSSTSETHGR